MAAVMHHAQRTAGVVANQAKQTATSVGVQLRYASDKLVPPEQREQKIKDLQSFASRNPKLAAFLAAQITVIGIPLLLFIAFGLSTLLISLAAALLISIFSALTYTFFVVGISLFFLIPTLFIASCTATCFFLWGLTVYMILQRLNGGTAPAKRDGMESVRDQDRGRLARTSGVQFRPEFKNNDPPRQTGNEHANGYGEWEQKWPAGTPQKQ